MREGLKILAFLGFAICGGLLFRFITESPFIPLHPDKIYIDERDKESLKKMNSVHIKEDPENIGPYLGGKGNKMYQIENIDIEKIEVRTSIRRYPHVAYIKIIKSNGESIELSGVAIWYEKEKVFYGDSWSISIP